MSSTLAGGAGDAPPQDSSRSNSASGSSAASACSAARSQRAAGSRGASAAASPRAAARASGLPLPPTTCTSGSECLPLWQVKPAPLARETPLLPTSEEAFLLSTVAVFFTCLTRTVRALVTVYAELERRQQAAEAVRALPDQPCGASVILGKIISIRYNVQYFAPCTGAHLVRQVVAPALVPAGRKLTEQLAIARQKRVLRAALPHGSQQLRPSSPVAAQPESQAVHTSKHGA